MQKIIVNGCKADQVKAEFDKQGMLMMKTVGVIKALQGITTIDEVLRVTRE